MNKWDRIHEEEGQISDGYVLLPRAFDDSPISRLPPCTREIFSYLLRNVNHAPFKGLNRGQGYFHFKQIQEDLHWYVGFRKMTYSKPELTKALRRQREARMIETMKATRGIIVTISNYDYYQTPSNYEGNNEGNKNGLRRNHEGSQDIQEQKNVNNNNTDHFEVFWNQYHKITGLRKTDREAAHKHWKKLTKAEQAKAIEKIQAYSDSEPDKKFCKIARTYLSGKSFNNQFENTAQQAITVNEQEYDD